MRANQPGDDAPRHRPKHPGAHRTARRTLCATLAILGLATSALCAAAFCARNLRVAGVPLVTLGLMSNAFVVAANGAMPVSVAAADRADVPVVDIAVGQDSRHEIADSTTTLRFLGDVIPVPLPARSEVVSPGDVLVAAGLAELIVMGMLRTRRRDNDVE